MTCFPLIYLELELFELGTYIFTKLIVKKTYVQPRFTAERMAFVNLGSIGKAAIFLPVSVNLVTVNSASLISIAPKSKILF